MANPSGWQRDEAEWQKRNAFLVAELRKRDIDVTPQFRVQNYGRTPYEAAWIEAIIASLEHAPGERELCSYVGMMGATKAPYDGTKLIALYNETTDRILKSAIVHTLTQSRPINISGWFRQMLEDPTEDRDSRETVAALIGYADKPKQYIPLLMEHYDELRGCALTAFDKIADVSVINFLKSKRGVSYDWSDKDIGTLEGTKVQQKRLEKVIAKLERKAARQEQRKQQQ